ncbi:uncharacterized protein BCR38DRAFT_436114 [Pseudomassariella vexata]|uniref:Large ribosomal subunit protein uL23m n=1 Tax=Pseudomassariella vexata TaxID=1141098 RepID=A0A1Y2DV66_9PEZI|nr:uncharacterized protein BCR38DRAFT_436114 [Pseudomassariella vexata]ORY63180.1 hypothetical protein BCR38DRAFT_436114 [Pseudomassariella vexata]
MAAAARGVKTGTKQVFLPQAIVTLCRPPTNRILPPQFAHFRVPLRFNKLDIRDYLQNLYNVESVGVRSHILQRSPRRNPITRRIGRPPPWKFMTVEMKQPFVWPVPLTEEETHKWHNEEMRQRIQATKHWNVRKQQIKQAAVGSSKLVNETHERGRLAKQAHDLLTGKVKWENKRELDPKWTKGKAS